jgi:hypothetical protein
MLRNAMRLQATPPDLRGVLPADSRRPATGQNPGPGNPADLAIAGDREQTGKRSDLFAKRTACLSANARAELYGFVLE